MKKTRNLILSPGRRTLPGVEFGNNKYRPIITAAFIVACFVYALTAHNTPVFAQTPTTQPTSPTPTAVQATPVLPSPTSVPSPSPAPTVSAPTVIPSAAPTPLPSPFPTGVIMPATVSASVIYPTQILTAQPTPTPIVNTAAIVNNIIIASTASAQANVMTQVNTTATGSQPTVINYTNPTSSAISLPGTASCDATSGAFLSAMINNATVTNAINVQSITGNGSATTTQNANASANLFTMANTVLSGSCWHFQVVNFFAPHTGNVTLPSFLSTFKPTAATMQPASVAPSSGANTVSVDNVLNANANSGNSQSPFLQTGNANATINSQEVLNTVINGNNWLFLNIRSFGGWTGSLMNWPGTVITTPGNTFAYLSLPDAMPNNPVPSVVNNAGITNTVNVLADSGSVSTSSAATTGSSRARINLFDLVNTTLTGNNWYYAYITIFDSFSGDFLFPQPPVLTYALPPVIPGTAAPHQETVASVSQPVDIIPTLPVSQPIPSIQPQWRPVPTVAVHLTRHMVVQAVPTPTEHQASDYGLAYTLPVLLISAIQKYKELRAHGISFFGERT